MAIYHLSVRGGTRAKGSVAARKSDYIQREKQYERQPDRCVHRESGNMPGWAEDNPRDYWRAADEHERSNGRVYMEVEVALPRELDQEKQIELAREFARELTRESNLPYTMAVHEGRAKDGQGDNPHAHMMISERQNDGHDRDREQWFRRANREEPERGGAPKTREFHGGRQIRELRETWEREANRALEREHSRERVDHRSLREQGIDREPTRHIGPGIKAEVDKELERERAREQERGLERARDPEHHREHGSERDETRSGHDELRQAQRELDDAKREYERAYRDLHQERGYERDGGRGMGD